jgi:hypothetical protein
MTESQTPAGGGDAAAPSAGRPRRRQVSRSKSTARPRTRRPSAAAKRKPAAASRPAARGRDLQGLLRAFASKASAARGHIVSASGSGAERTRRAWRTVSGSSRKTIDRLAAEWKQMDSAKKAQVLAALLSALAAASAPLVRRGLKKR